MAAGQKGLLDFVGYRTGAPVVAPAPPSVVGSTPIIIFDMQQTGLMELQSFFPYWAIANGFGIGNVVEHIDIACGDLTNTINVGGTLDNSEGLIHCCM